MDIQALLESHGDDAPSGENLEYDPAFIELELAAQPGEERQIGDEILAAEAPDYADVVAKALSIMERSHDLRAGVYLAGAILHTEGLQGLADATSYLRGCIEDFWDTCHPQLDADDDNDPTMRVNSIKDLTASTAVLGALRRAPLSDSRSLGRFSLRDIMIANGEIAASGGSSGAPDSNTISAAFKDTDPDHLAALNEAIKTTQANIKAIDAKFNEETPGQGPDLDEFAKTLRQIAKHLAEHLDSSDSAEADADETEGEKVVARPISGGGSGGISSPSDVSAALDSIINYYQRAEPSSPVPILLHRAKRLVSASFMAIMKDMAPQGVENVNLIGGINEDDD